jgi:parvulin-like peptidyl-prolyl isomerase
VVGRRGEDAMTPLLGAWLALAACALPPAASGSSAHVGLSGKDAAPGNVVARVNGEPVSKAELDRMLGNPLTRSQLAEELGGNAGPKALEHFALRKAIQHHLLLQEAERRGIELTRQDLDRAVGALRRRFADLESFGKWMTEQGLDDKGLYEALRGDMMAGRVWAELTKGVRVSEDQAQRYYAEHRDELARGEEVRLRIIAVREEAAANEMLTALEKGASFAKLARQRSEGLRAAQAGDTGWLDSRTLPEPLAKAVAQLEKGDVAGPLKNEAGEFLLVGLEGRRPMPARSFDEARPEIERRLLPAAQRTAMMAWLSEQERKSTIEVLSSN